jgi:DNA invertase Pin-like site-specific DNA recombinase
MKATPRAYSYLRFSSPEQSKGDSQRRQTVLAEEYAKRHGLTLDTELNLKDLGVSAFRGDNVATGALGAFLKAISDGLVPKGSYLLVESLDRVSRKEARKAVRILEEIVEAGVTVVTLNDGKQYTEESLSGTDFLIAIIILMRAHEESATKAKRVRAAWIAKRERAARGEVQTVRVPAWVDASGSAAKDAKDARLTLNKERAALVRRMFEMFLSGQGKHAIADTLNGEKVPTWGAGKGRAAAKYWHRSYVFKILTNPAVTGRFVPHIDHYEAGRLRRQPQQPIEGYYPRVIDEDTWQSVQTLIGARRGTVRRQGNVASLVAGLARCPLCSSTMTRISKGSRKKAGPPKLVCTKAKAGAGCTYRMVKLSDVERVIIENARHLSPPLVEEDLEASIEGHVYALSELRDQIETLVDQIECKPSPALSARLAKREAEAEEWRAELQKLQAQAADSESRIVNLRAKRLSEALLQLKKDPQQTAAANQALRECMEKIVVDYKESVLRLHWRHGGKPTALMYAWPED